MRSVVLALSSLSLLALASGCGVVQRNDAAVLPSEAHATAAPSGASTFVSTPGVLQGSPGYVAASGRPILADNSTFGTPAYVVHPDTMGGRLVASNSAVYSNNLAMSRPNLYERYDLAPGFRAQALAQAQAMSGGTTPPRQAVSRRQNVYFDFDKSELTPGGDEVVNTLAQQLHNDPNMTLTLVGKADLTGTDDYNMGLSERRAQTVRNRFVAAGVDPSRIETRWVGFREPPVPTAKGVREARNRVVQMDLSTMAGGTVPPATATLGRRVLWTTTEGSPPGTSGEELPGLIPNGSTGTSAGNQ